MGDGVGEGVGATVGDGDAADGEGTLAVPEADGLGLAAGPLQATRATIKSAMSG